MNWLNNGWKNLTRGPARSSRNRPVKSRRPPRATLSVQELESRDLLSTLLVLDFNGATAAEYGRVQAQLYGEPASKVREGFSSFLGGFRTLQAQGYANYSFLDFNGDLRLDEEDGRRAADLIVQRVWENFAPYDVTVVREDNSDVARALMGASPSHDAIIFVDGRDYSAGLAAVDPGNTRDDSGWAGGSVGTAIKVREAWLRGELTYAEMRDAFVQDLAMGASHEAGHTFGLQHILDPVGVGAWDVSIMAGGNYRNQVFADVWYQSDGWNGVQPAGWQNEHEYLRYVLRPSPYPWAEVLRPGELTIQGSGYNDRAEVTRTAAGDWTVRLSYWNGTSWVWTTRHVDPSATPDLNSLNQFRTAVNFISFRGEGGDDVLDVSALITAVVWGFGGDGSDRLSGGGGGDWLVGNNGNDTLRGGGGDDLLQGGDGGDWLYGGAGNDLLYGGRGNDFLIGEAGRDSLYGEENDDMLIGGYLAGIFPLSDGEPDVLNGGSGADLFDQYYSIVYWTPPGGSVSIPIEINEETIVGFNPSEGDRMTRRRLG